MSEPTVRLEAIEPARDGRETGVLAQAKRGFVTTMRDAGDWRSLRKTPYGLRPVLMMGAVSLVLGFSASILTVGLPSIVKDRGINAPALLQMFALMGFFLIFISLGISYALDRLPRVPFFAGGAIVQGVMSVFTGASNGIWGIGASQAAVTLGDTAGSTPLFSLQADYYPPEARGKMFAVVGTISRIGAYTAPVVVGYLIGWTSWRVPYFIFGPMLAALGVISLFVLKEPVRGYMERKALGATEEEALSPEKPPSFGEAWRTIWGIGTLRRLFIGGVFGSAGDSLFVFTWALMLVQFYNFSAAQLGWLLFVRGLFAIVGGFLGGGIVDVLMKRRPQRVLIFSGAFGTIFAIVMGIQALHMPVWMLYVLLSLLGFFGALLGPARSVFYAQILPANMRTLGLGVTVLGQIPGTIFAFLLAGRIATWGLPAVFFWTAPFYLIESLIDMSAASLFERDARNAILSQMASQEYKRAREAGRLKLLVCRGIDVAYDGVQVLFGVDFEVEAGEIVALLGTNGAGKSTLLRAIAGVHEASGGAVVYDGRDITHVPPYEIAQAGVVFMPGGRGVFPGLTVRENLSLGTWGMEDAITGERVEAVLEMFPTLNAKQDARAGTMSGGEQQMLALAMAFLSRPRLLLIDELSLGLAPAVVSELLDAVRAMRDAGVTVVLVEQSVNVALTVADRAVFMEKGEVKFTGPAAELLRRPDILRAVYVRGSAAVGEGNRAPAVTGLLERDAVLRVEDVGVSFGGVRALDGVSFELRDGEILGIVGPNGAGKTTLFDAISGFLPDAAGRVWLEGVDISGEAADARARAGLVRRFQDARLYPGLTVFETVLVALDKHHRSRSMLATAVRAPRARSSERLLRRRADELIEMLGLGNARDKFVRELSTGMRRITDLACVVAMEPKVLLLDEPSSGIAQAEAEALAPLLRRIRAEAGCSILLIEHDMPLITRASDELMAMVQGRVVTRGPADEVLSHPTIVEAYLGSSDETINRSGVLA